MTLLEDIQNSAVDSKSDIAELLRKCKVLAARLGSKSLENWILWESNGYPKDVLVPDYRIWELEVKGDFVGAFGSQIKNAKIPFNKLPEKSRQAYEKYQCRQSIASLEMMTSKGTKGGTLSISTGDLFLFLGNKVYQNYSCLQ